MVDQVRGQEIKVQIPHLKPRSEPKPQYVYHWDRIIGALAVLGVLIGLMGYGIYEWLSPFPPPTPAEVEGKHRPEEIVAGAAQQPKGAAQGPIPPLPARVTAAADRQPRADVLAVDAKSPDSESEPAQVPPKLAQMSNGAPRQAEGEAAGAEAPPAGPARPERAELPVSEEIPEPRLSHTPDSAKRAEPIPAPKSGDEEGQRITGQGSPDKDRPVSSNADAAGRYVRKEPMPVTESSGSKVGADAPEKASGKGRFRHLNTSIASPAVKRFVLARSVVGNEPKGDLGDIIANAGSASTVSSFSEVIGLKGEVLKYRWLHEGKQVLQIRVPVGAQRWRSHSTKRIYERMKGAWRAELRDSAGNLLASIDFVF